MSVYSSVPTVASGTPYDDASATRKNEHGNIIFGEDEARYVYVEAAEAILAGQLCQFAPQNTSLQNLSVAATPRGSKTITTTSNVTLTAGQLVGSYIGVTTGAGMGSRFKIAYHPPVTAGTVTFEVEEFVLTALDTTSKIDICLDPYNQVIVAPVSGSATSAPIGFATTDIGAGQFGWLQRLGVGLVRNDANAAITPGLTLSRSSSVAGTVRASSIVTLAIVARAVTGIAQNEAGFAEILL